MPGVVGKQPLSVLKAVVCACEGRFSYSMKAFRQEPDGLSTLFGASVSVRLRAVMAHRREAEYTAVDRR